MYFYFFRQIKNGLFRLFTPYGFDKPKAYELTHELLEKSGIKPTVSAVTLSMDEIRSICFSFKLLQEQEKLTLLKDNDNNFEECVELDFKSDDNENIPSDPKFIVQF